jgi:hypothetical protein
MLESGGWVAWGRYEGETFKYDSERVLYYNLINGLPQAVLTIIISDYLAIELVCEQNYL